ncbi:MULTISPECIES: PRC-barrel domain-containing protein [Bacillaceae]|uniref:PRC-barrel domain-containing protein n=1 Tax=Bacillaceae TaxID=186817 RepID=UPI001BDE1C06|nr:MULTISPECIES: PRC-barrel domain-containing protein [Bacillaceae]MDX8359469.1 PRC-barrel domain-containing protein [Cytobacillus sp. IB215316]
MRTFSLLKGLPVYSHDGKQLGNVVDLLVQEDGKVASIVVEGKRLFQRDTFIPIESVLSFDNDGITISSSTTKYSTRQEKNTHYLNTHHSLAKKFVKSENGEVLGILEDVFFQEELGTIEGYKITDGFFSDISDGKKVIKSNDFTVNKDTIIFKAKRK